MILITDVYYNDNGAYTAGVIAANWKDEKPEYETLVHLPDAAEYVPGKFYLRELPCILELLKKIAYKPDVIIIDGYVTLGKEQKDGLGMHLYKALNSHSAVIGIAKSKYKDTPEETVIFRGKSRRPLYITSAGMYLEEAKNIVLEMHGPNRIPTLIKRADQLSRNLIKS